MTLIAVLVLAGLVAVVGVGLYNRLVRLRVGADEAWAGIETQLKRRHDLIPNLVETVKGYVTHEREVLERVTELRSRAMQAATPAEKGAAEGLLGQALARLYAVAENYPQLRASENFTALQQALGETENMIAGARQVYNGAVRALNTAVDTVPTNLLAGWFGFTRREFFEIQEPGERTVPQVRFS